MRRTCILFIIGLTGCAQHKPANPAPESPDPVLPPASALVFDRPLLAQRTSDDYFDRDWRRNGAFVGYERGLVSYYYVRQEDRQGDLRDNRFERRSIVQEQGMRYR
jgi:hypothetical protein